MKLFKLTIPVFLELLISSLFGMVDMMMVGNSDPTHITMPSIAAIGITNQMMFIGIAMAQVISARGTAMIARYCGANREEKVPNVVKHLVVLIILILIIPFVTVNQLIPERIMSFIGAKIVSNIISLSFAPGQAFGIAESTLLGKSLGEERIDKAETFIKETNRLTLIASMFFGLLFFFFGPKLTSLYTDDPLII